MASVLQKMRVKSIEQVRNNQIFVTLSDGSKTFISYGTPIATIEDGQVTLDSYYWDYSRTTLKHLHIFLGTSSKKEIENKIANGEYKLEDLQ